jgi:hypothetical protein
MDIPPDFSEFDPPNSRPDRYTVSEQTARAMWVLNNDSRALYVTRVNGQPFGADGTVALPSGAVVKAGSVSLFERDYLIYDPNHAFDHLLRARPEMN